MENLSTWCIGLLGNDLKYLSEESFGGKLTVNGQNLRMRQVFVLEPSAEGFVSLRCFSGKYLTAHSDGKIDGNGDEIGDEQLFTVEVQANGKWCFKAKSNGRWFGGSGDALDAFSKTIEGDREWAIHIAMHPHVNVLNPSRKAYLHLVGDKVTTDEDIPWGVDATMCLTYSPASNTYQLKTCDDRFVSHDGKLHAKQSKETDFTLEFHGNLLAFRTDNGKYLSSTGGDGSMGLSRSNVAAKDELFELRDSQAQFKLTGENGRLVSCSGEQLSACQDVQTDKELFQMEVNRATKKIALRAFSNSLWSCNPDGKITHLPKKVEAGAPEWFDVEWNKGTCSIRACNGKYVALKPNGALVASENDASAPTAVFAFELINRPQIIFRSMYGFIYTNDKGLLKCHGDLPEVFNLTFSHGLPKLTNKDNLSWRSLANGVSLGAGGGDELFFEFVEHSKVAIRSNGLYFQAFKNGDFKLSAKSIDQSSLFEY